MALLCRSLNIPISWRKCELSHTVHWIGWTFHVAAGFIALPEPKIDKLLASQRVKRPDLEKAIGLAMWVTQLFPNMRIWLQYLYHDLYTLPSTNYSIDPDNWNTLAPCLNDQMTFVKRPPGTMIPIGGTLVSVRHIATPDLDQFASQTNVFGCGSKIQIRKDVMLAFTRTVSCNSINNGCPIQHLICYLDRNKCGKDLQQPTHSLQGIFVALGSFIRSPSGETHWFSERYTGQQFADLNIDLDSDLQKSITSMETLAQIAILWISCKIYPGHRIPITLPSFSDNTGAESGSNLLFSTKKPQCWFLEKLCLLSPMSGMEMNVGHIAGPINIEADGLSRWDGNGSPLQHFRASDRVRICESLQKRRTQIQNSQPRSAV